MIITITGLTSLMSCIQRSQDALDRPKKALQDSFTRYGSMEHDVFTAEGAAWGGSAWQGLSEWRIAERMGSEHPILDYTGQLKAAMVSGNFSGDKVSSRTTYLDREATQVVSGYKTLNEGDEKVSRKSKSGKTINLPKRPFVLFNNRKMLDEIKKVWKNWINAEIFRGS